MSFWLQLPIEKKKGEKRGKQKKKIKCIYIKYIYNIFFNFFKIRKKNWNSKNSLILEKWNTARSLYANLKAHTLAKQNLTRLFYSSMKYHPVQHLLALLSLLLYCYAIFSCQGNGTGKNMPRPLVALKNRGRKAEQWKRLHLTTHTLTFPSLTPNSVKSTNSTSSLYFLTR